MPHTSKQPYLHTNEYYNTAVVPAKPHRPKVWGILPDKRKVPHGWPACLRRQPPRVAFRNNDIYVVDNEESSNYEELRERHPKVQYMLWYVKIPQPKICLMRRNLMIMTTNQ